MALRENGMGCQKGQSAIQFCSIQFLGLIYQDFIFCLTKPKNLNSDAFIENADKLGMNYPTESVPFEEM